MSRILVLGGYGGFGARLTRRLAGRGHHVLVAGRSLDKARAFSSGLENTEPVLADRTRDLDSLLAACTPELVIDAAGPFQDSDYRLPLACAAASVPYLDLADATEFVTGIGAVDAAARAGNVPIITGASSVPALSGAVARHLASGLDAVRTVEVAISASNRAVAGVSVVAAILSYVGRPLRVWRGRRWVGAFGWQGLRRRSFETRGGPPLMGRWLALADVPDHRILVEMLPGRPAVAFYAGTEIALHTIGLWLSSWPVRWFGLSWPGWLAPAVTALQKLTRFLSDGRSAMSVTLKGVTAGIAVERRWILVAENGDGPEIPTLAAVILAEEVLAGRVDAGARDAGGLISLAQFQPLFASLAIRHETHETKLPPPLYRRVMGARFDDLPRAIRDLHRVSGDAGASGVAQVTRGTVILARMIGAIMRFPAAGTHALHVTFEEHAGVETWTRQFGRHRFSSRLSQSGSHLVERFGPLSFYFDLPSDPRGLTLRMTGWRCLGLPLPMALAPRTSAREWQEDDRFMFDVPIALPLIGPIVHYRGWLTLDA